MCHHYLMLGGSCQHSETAHLSHPLEESVRLLPLSSVLRSGTHYRSVFNQAVIVDRDGRSYEFLYQSPSCNGADTTSQECRSRPCCPSSPGNPCRWLPPFSSCFLAESHTRRLTPCGFSSRSSAFRRFAGVSSLSVRAWLPTAHKKRRLQGIAKHHHCKRLLFSRSFSVVFGMLGLYQSHFRCQS